MKKILLFLHYSLPRYIYMLQEYGYVYNVRRYGRSISSSAPNHVARADQLDADTGDISRQNFVLLISWFFALQYLHSYYHLPMPSESHNDKPKGHCPSKKYRTGRVRFEFGMLVFNSECSWCRALRGRGVRRLRVRGDSHGRRQVLLPPQEAAGLGPVRITTKTNSKVVFAQE